jgi:hypothetical protein
MNGCFVPIRMQLDRLAHGRYGQAVAIERLEADVVELIVVFPHQPRALPNRDCRATYRARESFAGNVFIWCGNLIRTIRE